MPVISRNLVTAVVIWCGQGELHAVATVNEGEAAAERRAPDRAAIPEAWTLLLIEYARSLPGGRGLSRDRKDRTDVERVGSC